MCCTCVLAELSNTKFFDNEYETDDELAPVEKKTKMMNQILPDENKAKVSDESIAKKLQEEFDLEVLEI